MPSERAPQLGSTTCWIHPLTPQAVFPQPPPHPQTELSSHRSTAKEVIIQREKQREKDPGGSCTKAAQFPAGTCKKQFHS